MVKFSDPKFTFFMFVLIFIFMFVPVRRHHYTTHVRLQLSIIYCHLEIFAAISTSSAYLQLSIITSSSIHIILKKGIIFDHFDTMCQYVVIKIQSVQSDFHENQPDTAAYLACTGISRQEWRTGTEPIRILKA